MGQQKANGNQTRASLFNNLTIEFPSSVGGTRNEVESINYTRANMFHTTEKEIEPQNLWLLLLLFVHFLPVDGGRSLENPFQY